MSRRSRHPLRWPLLAAALLLPAAACTDQEAGPTAAAPGAAGASLTGAAPGQPRLVPSHVRYRDRGARPATGRSGSATLSMQALQDRSGQTLVRMSTGPLEQWWYAPGTISRLQLKALQPDGTPIGVTNQDDPGQGNGYVAFALDGLARGTRLQAQAQVRGIDPHRTDVVTVADQVRLLPDLAVTLSAPTRAQAGMPVNVLATVQERNGDLGATTSCVLYVDGSPADWSHGVWVDAGDVVTCAFTVTFTLNGAHELRVVAEEVAPAEFDPESNAASATVEVGGGNDFSYEAMANDGTFRLHAVSDTRWWNAAGDSGSFGEDTREESHDQSAQIIAWMPRFVAPGTARLELSQSTGGRTVHAAVLEDVDGLRSDDGGFCTDYWYGEAGSFFYLCSTPGFGTGWTGVTYSRMAGVVTYHSSGYQRTWDNLSGTESFYSYNHSTLTETGLPLVTYGDDYTFLVRLSDGEHTWTANPVLGFTTQGGEFSQPRTCETTEVWWEPGLVTEVCTSREQAYTYRFGTARANGM